MTKGERIKALRERIGKSQVAFADLIGVSKQTLYKYENDIITNIPSDKIEEIAKVSGSTPGYIMGWESSSPATVFSENTIQIPVYSYVSAGPGCFADGNIETYVDIPEEMAKHGEYFGLRVKGDSMEPDIKDQDIIIVKKQDTAPDGKTVVAIVNGDEGFCKRLALYAEGLGLASNNPAYKPLYFTKDQVINLPVKILGVVSRLIREF